MYTLRTRHVLLSPSFSQQCASGGVVSLSLLRTLELSHARILSRSLFPPGPTRPRSVARRRRPLLRAATGLAAAFSLRVSVYAPLTTDRLPGDILGERKKERMGREKKE